MNQIHFLIELKTYIDKHFVSQAAYAKHIGLNPTYLSLVMHQKRPPTQRMVKDLGMMRMKYHYTLYFRE